MISSICDWVRATAALAAPAEELVSVAAAPTKLCAGTDAFAGLDEGIDVVAGGMPDGVWLDGGAPDVEAPRPANKPVILAAALLKMPAPALATPEPDTALEPPSIMAPAKDEPT